MNPLKWRREHQAALLIAAVLGFCVGIVLGFSLAGGGTSIGAWLGYTECFRFDYNSDGWCIGFAENLEWGLFGSLFAIGVIFVWHLMQFSERQK